MEIPAYIKVALAELGVSEFVGDADNPQILSYFGATNYPANQVADSVPWCSAFACWVLEKSGISSPKSAWSLSFLKWGVELKSPEFGAIAIFSRTTDPNKGHVGFILGWDEKNIILLSGNSANKVTVSSYPRSNVLGIRKPKV